MKNDTILNSIRQVQIVKYKDVCNCLQSLGIRLKTGKGSLIKFYFKSSVWTYHATGKEVKMGAIRELRKVLIKEGII